MLEKERTHRKTLKIFSAQNTDWNQHGRNAHPVGAKAWGRGNRRKSTGQVNCVGTGVNFQSFAVCFWKWRGQGGVRLTQAEWGAHSTST